jgi:hypothetical protein
VSFETHFRMTQICVTKPTGDFSSRYKMVSHQAMAPLSISSSAASA